MPDLLAIPLDLLEIVYGIVRYHRPKVVVETGVGLGGSSLFILKALHDNGCGRLYSIDLPEFDKYYPDIIKDYNLDPKVFKKIAGKIGWLVPEELRYRWELIEGDAKLELPKLLKKLERIDIFLHDSLHTYDHMMFEYAEAWEYLRDGGILMSDDVNEYWSLAFLDFCKNKNAQYIVIGERLGIAKKRSEKF